MQTAASNVIYDIFQHRREHSRTRLAWGQRGETHHAPVDPSQSDMGGESIVYTRHKAPPNQAYNAYIIQLIAHSVDVLGVIADSMICSTHTETQCRANKKTTEHEDICGVGLFVAGT